jgi:hypothetical protein
MRKYFEAAVLLTYTLLNLWLMYPLLSTKGYLIAVAVTGTGTNYLAIFVGLFLNAALLMYYLRTRPQN